MKKTLEQPEDLKNLRNWENFTWSLDEYLGVFSFVFENFDFKVDTDQYPDKMFIIGPVFNFIFGQMRVQKMNASGSPSGTLS